MCPEWTAGLNKMLSGLQENAGVPGDVTMYVTIHTTPWCSAAYRTGLCYCVTPGWDSYGGSRPVPQLGLH